MRAYSEQATLSVLEFATGYTRPFVQGDVTSEGEKIVVELGLSYISEAIEVKVKDVKGTKELEAGAVSNVCIAPSGRVYLVRGGDVFYLAYYTDFDKIDLGMSGISSFAFKTLVGEAASILENRTASAQFHLAQGSTIVTSLVGKYNYASYIEGAALREFPNQSIAHLAVTIYANALSLAKASEGTLQFLYNPAEKEFTFVANTQNGGVVLSHGEVVTGMAQAVLKHSYEMPSLEAATNPWKARLDESSKFTALFLLEAANRGKATEGDLTIAEVISKNPEAGSATALSVVHARNLLNAKGYRTVHLYDDKLNKVIFYDRETKGAILAYELAEDGEYLNIEYSDSFGKRNVLDKLNLATQAAMILRKHLPTYFVPHKMMMAGLKPITK